MPDSSTILLVDDEDAVQKLLAYPLERDGFKVVQARDGEEALARFAEQRFDLVVLDLMLPKLDGLEVCKRLRAVSMMIGTLLEARRRLQTSSPSSFGSIRSSTTRSKRSSEKRASASSPSRACTTRNPSRSSG